MKSRTSLAHTARAAAPAAIHTAISKSRASLAQTARAAAPAALLAAVALSAPSCGAPLVPPRQGLVVRDVSYPLKDLRFPSGLRVVAERDARTPFVGLFLVVGSGSTSDPPGKEGLAHFVEHLAFRSRPFGKSSVWHMLDRAGAGQKNAFTELDATVYFELGPVEALAQMLRIEGARMLVPVANVTPETFETERGVVRSELRQRNETGFAGEVYQALQAALFPAAHPYARSIGGSHESLAAVEPDDVAAFLKAHYRPDNMTLVVLGDLDLGTIADLIQKSLPPELLAASGAPPRPPARMPAVAPEPPAPPPTTGILRKEGAVATPELWIGWSLPRGFDTDAYLVDLVTKAAARELDGAERADDDIADVMTTVSQGKEASILICRVVLARGAHPERTLDHVVGRMHRVWRFAGGSLSAQQAQIEFDERKRGEVVGMLFEAEDLRARGIARAMSTHFSGESTMYSRALSQVARLEQRRMLEFASKYLTRDRARGVLFTPPRGGGALPPGLGVGASAPDEVDPLPVRADEARLRAAAPPLGVASYRQISLRNGLEVILGRRAGLPVVSAGLLLRGGRASADVPAAATAALWLALPREKWHGSPAAFGATLRRHLGDDAMVYRLDGASGNAGIMLAVLAEVARSLKVDTGAWASFKREYVPYLQLADQKPEAAARRGYLAALFPDHPYGRTDTGRAFAELDPSATDAWLTATHAPNNAVLAVVGDIDVAEIEKVVIDQFDGWSRKDEPSRLPAPIRPQRRPAPRPALVVAARPGATQAQIRFGCLLPPAYKSEEMARYELAASLIRERLNATLRRGLGVTYGFSARAQALPGAAYLDIQGAVEADKLGASLAWLKGALAELSSTSASETELAWAKLWLAGGEGTSTTATGALVEKLLSLRNLGYPLTSADTFAQDLAAVTADALKDDYTLCQAGNPTLAIVGEEGAARAAFKEAWP